MQRKTVSILSPYEYLLLGARDDRLVPLDQFYSQAKTLINVRSFSSRLFTASEEAGSHCHIGNQGLANRVILDWLLQTIDGDSAPSLG